MSIEGLEKLLSNQIKNEEKILDTRITNLVAPGENYGGELLRVEIITEDETTKTKNVVQAVAKKIPPTEVLQKQFNVQQTFKAEILFYKKLVPILQQFQKENGVEDVIDCFAKFYGGRINLNGSDVVDRDAVIVMENLIISGYKNLDRHIGYNLEETQILLKDLANLQSTVVALKLKKAEFFFKEFRPLCCNTLGYLEHLSCVAVVVRDILLECDSIAAYIPKVMETYKKYSEMNFKYEAREPFATISHCDLWVNNAMMKYENGKPTKNVFIDFQLYSYKSPVFDLLNFLITSVQMEVLKNNFDNLIKYYHSEFVLNLQRLGCDTEPFSYSKFEEELTIDAGLPLKWALLFIPMVVFDEKAQKDDPTRELNYNDEAFLNKIKLMRPECREKLIFLVETFAKKGWLNN